MTVLTMNFQVYLVYILEDNKHQSFSIFFLLLVNFFKVRNSLMTLQITFLHVNLSFEKLNLISFE